MCRRDNDSAVREMRGHDVVHQGLSAGVERGRRFVEQPDRPGRDAKFGERGAALLPGRKIGRRQMRDMGEAEFGERFAWARSASIGAQQGGVKFEVLDDGERCFEGVGMADVMRLLGKRFLGRGRQRKRALPRAEASRRGRAARSIFRRRWARLR